MVNARRLAAATTKPMASESLGSNGKGRGRRCDGIATGRDQKPLNEWIHSAINQSINQSICQVEWMGGAWRAFGGDQKGTPLDVVESAGNVASSCDYM